MVIDDIGQHLSTDITYRRIISLVPSTTETLFSFGLQDKIAGCTRFCVHPYENTRSLPKVGGTKDIEIQRILDLKPDLIIANAEENTREIFAEIQKHNIPLYVAYPKTVDQALQDLLRLGDLLQVSDIALDFHTKIQTAKNQLQSQTFSFAYLIWRKPWMVVSQDCFISDLITQFGGRNIFVHTDHQSRYPEIELQDLTTADVVFLSSEPYPFHNKHIEEIHQQTGFKKHKFQLVDGEFTSWHGTRMLQTFLNAQLFSHKEIYKHDK